MGLKLIFLVSGILQVLVWILGMLHSVVTTLARRFSGMFEQ